MPKLKLERIFHPTDFTAGDVAAWTHALKIALTVKGELSLLHVNEEGDDLKSSNSPHIRSTLKKWGVIEHEDSKEEFARTKMHLCRVNCDSQEPVAEITNYMRMHPQDLTVLSTHQRKGMFRLINTPLAEPIMQASATMTLVVPRGVKGFVSHTTGEIRLKNILIPVENRNNSMHAMKGIIRLIKTLGCKDVDVILLHAGESFKYPHIELPKKFPGNFHRIASPGPVVDAVLNFAKHRHADLIVMTTHGHKGLGDALMGSTTERVIRSAKCPVLVVSEN